MRLLLVLSLTVAACDSASAVSEDLAMVADLAMQPPADAAVPADLGFDVLGTPGGPCGVIPPLLLDPASSLVENQILFMPPEMYARAALSPDGQRLYDTPNAGGSSTESEVMAFELLRNCEGAK